MGLGCMPGGGASLRLIYLRIEEEARILGAGGIDPEGTARWGIGQVVPLPALFPEVWP